MRVDPLRHVHRGLAILLLIAAGLESMHVGYGAPALASDATVNRNSVQPDLKAMIEQAYQMQKEGNFILAEEIWRRLLSIFESLGADDPAVATIAGNLARVLERQGRYTVAEPLLLRSLAIREKALGPGDPYVAESLNNLAVLFWSQGRYGAAESHYRRSLAIYEKALGPEHPEVATSLNNLASLSADQGKLAEAELFYRRSLSIRERALGSDHPAVAESLGNLGLFLATKGLYGTAKIFLRRSLEASEKILGLEHRDVATGLNNLALLLHKEGKYSDAEPLYKRSLAIREKVLGPDHPDVANALGNLAVLLHEEGRYLDAEPLYRRSLAIREKVLGPEHPDVADALNSLVSLLSEKGLFSDAITALNKSLTIENRWLLRELPILSDQVRSSQLRQLGNAWELVFQWTNQHPFATQLALETRLNRHGLLLEIEQRQGILRNTPGVDQAKVEQLQSLTQQLASVSLPPDRRTALRQQRDRIQSELYRQLPELQIQLVTPAQVAKALPADGVLVEFQRYRPWDGRKPKNQRWGEAQYIALVLKPNGSISSVLLGPAADIEATVHKGLGASAEGLTDAEAIWAQLSSQVLKPLLPQLSGSRQWFLSPDGELNRVPFSALPAPQQSGTPLAQAVQLRLLTTGRELVRLQTPTPPSTPAMVMANPSYDRANTQRAPATRPDRYANGAQRRSAELISTRWNPLPATQREGQQVASLLGSGLISGPTATTSTLQRQRGPALLHIASHGFFVADSEKEPAKPFLALQDQSTLLQPLRGEDPQLRSGLVFAGANQPDVDPNDDGYLTAAEAVNLNLNGTQLVVLSACSTGQGNVRTGEGVYGLQRSFTVAGARSTLLSLWKVDDAATAEFMGRFYKRLKAGEGRADALAAVQAEFRSGAVRGPGGEDWSPPYYWAAWQLVGDWRPIKGL